MLEVITYTDILLVSYRFAIWLHLGESPSKKCSLLLGSHIKREKRRKVAVSPRCLTHRQRKPKL